VDDLGHCLAIVAWREPSHLVFEAWSGLGTDPNLASENLETQKLYVFDASDLAFVPIHRQP
jgi:hypothetical protein